MKGTTEPIKNLGIAERKAELAQVCAVDKNIVDLNERIVQVIDDVMTTGTTADSFMRGILEEFPQTRQALKDEDFENRDKDICMVE